MEANYGGNLYKTKGSLFDILDQTVTPYGRRLLKKWISNPLTDIKEINRRLDAIEELDYLPNLRENIQL